MSATGAVELGGLLAIRLLVWRHAQALFQTVSRIITDFVRIFSRVENSDVGADVLLDLNPVSIMLFRLSVS